MTKPTLTPSDIYTSLTYQDAPAAIEWLCNAFGFTKRLVVPGPDDTVLHSELTYGTGIIMVSSARLGEHRRSPLTFSGVHAALSVCVEDPDAHYEVAKSAGARILSELKDEEYGSRGYMAKDLEGHHWCFANYRPGLWWDGGDGPK